MPDPSCAHSGSRPVNVEVCVVGMCSCAVDADCADVGMYGSFVCGPNGVCVCGPGWAGINCNTATIPLAQLTQDTPTSNATCGGVVLANGVCCRSGVVDSVTGVCCESGATLDAQGRCCSAGLSVDACGVCGGGGVVVDVFGKCCSGSLPPSGQCCVSGNVDACGVCDGLNECDVSLTTVLYPEVGCNVSLPDDATVAWVLGVPMGAIWNVTFVANADGSVSGD